MYVKRSVEDQHFVLIFSLNGRVSSSRDGDDDVGVKRGMMRSDDLKTGPLHFDMILRRTKVDSECLG